MKKGNLWKKIEGRINTVMPMTLSNLLIFLLILYFIFIVGKTTWANYQSNKSIAREEQSVSEFEEEINFIQNQVNYLRTSSFREKEAREKLGYKLIGEKVISLPLDKPEDKIDDEVVGKTEIKVPNYRLWWSYFMNP